MDEHKNPGVVIGYCFSTTTSGWFTFALADLVRVDGMSNKYLTEENGGGLIAVSSGPRVAEARNTIIDNFARDYPDAEWLLMIDTDMTFKATLLNSLMAIATPEETPVLGGLCFTGGKAHDPHPTIYREIQTKAEEYRSVEVVDDYPRDALVKVGATGGACMLIHRTVFAHMGEKFRYLRDGSRNPYPWFAEGAIGPGGEAWGEDILFCLRCTGLGIPVHVHTGVKLGHVKSQVIDEVYFDNYRKAKEMDELFEKATSGEHPVLEGAAVGRHGGTQPSTNGDGSRAERRRKARELAKGKV